jgi:predicted ArsR family transcriptional regulator
MTTLQQQAKALGDPTRHAIFRFISDAATPVGVADINSEFPFNHNAIRQHLAKLVAAGLVDERRDQAVRPGRPRLIYTVADGADSRWGMTSPYERLSVLLAEIIETGDDPITVGRRAGANLAAAAAPTDDIAQMMTSVMAQQGFAPDLRRKVHTADIVLGTCPFESAALGHRDTICTMHLGIAEGLATASDSDVTVTELVAKDPRRAQCRIRLRLDG